MLTENPTLKEKIRNRINEIKLIADEMPGIVLVHNMRDLSIEYMSQRGLDILGVSLDELIAMGPKYHAKFFNEEETKEQVPKMIGLLERNNDNELVALFQQVRRNENYPWEWYCTSVKIFMRDENGNPLLTIGIAIPIDPNHHLSQKVSRLLEENNFLRQNGDKFHDLTKREKMILKHVVLGKSTNEIAEELFVSPHTVDTHRKNIKQKLDTNNLFVWSQYARAFDLI